MNYKKMLEREDTKGSLEKKLFLYKNYKELEPFFNEISDPLIVIDDGCIIKKANPSASAMLNIPNLPLEKNYNLLNFIIDGVKREQIETTIKNLNENNNVIEKVNFSSAPIMPLNADLCITESDNLESIKDQYTVLLKKDDKIEELEKLNKLKSEFLAQMSHEIRTPLNTMLSFINLIKDEVEDKISSEISSSFKQIDNAGRRIIRTIDLLLNLSEIHSGTYEYIPIKFDLINDVIANIEHDLLSQAKEKNIKISFQNSKSKLWIYADKFKVEEICKQIIENAIKFTKNGYIKISSRKYKNNNVVLEIIDTGIGISENYQPFMFEPFTQEEQGYCRSFEGNGVGLALVKRYCDLNNIILKVKSQKGKGSKFTLVFPAN